MENWLKIHEYISNNELVQAILIYIVAEILKRLLPSKSKETIAEIAGKSIHKIFDKAKLPNNVKSNEEKKE